MVSLIAAKPVTIANKVISPIGGKYVIDRTYAKSLN